jgi:hypothetical protein
LCVLGDIVELPAKLPVAFLVQAGAGLYRLARASRSDEVSFAHTASWMSLITLDLESLSVDPSQGE